MPFGHPERKAVGKNGDDFAADGADALRGLAVEGADALEREQGGGRYDDFVVGVRQSGLGKAEGVCLEGE
jgi:hypothetical protein